MDLWACVLLPCALSLLPTIPPLSVTMRQDLRAAAPATQAGRNDITLAPLARGRAHPPRPTPAAGVNVSGAGPAGPIYETIMDDIVLERRSGATASEHANFPPSYPHAFDGIRLCGLSNSLRVYMKGVLV